MAAHPLETATIKMQGDFPRITDAMKNFVSVLSSQQDEEKVARKHELLDVMALAKVALKEINAHTLPEPSAWNVAHPQEEEEQGTERMRLLTEYKAARILMVQCREAPAAANAKLTKLVGREYLRATLMWEDCVRDATARAIAAAPKKFPAATVDAFLDGWSASLRKGGVDEDLIWATDFQEAVRARGNARRKEVAERCERMESGQSEADALRAALAAGPEAGGGGGAQAEDAENRFEEVLPEVPAAAEMVAKAPPQQQLPKFGAVGDDGNDDTDSGDDDDEDEDDDDEDGESDRAPRVWEVPMSAEAEAMLAALPANTKGVVELK